MERRGLDPVLAAAGGGVLLSAGIIGVWLLDNWAPADPVRLLIVAAFGYLAVAGLWLPGRCRFIPVVTAGGALLMIGAIALGPLISSRWYLIHPDALETSPNPAWIGVMLAGPLFATVLTWRRRDGFTREVELHHWIALWVPVCLTLLSAGTTPAERTPTDIGVIRAQQVTADGIEYVFTDGSAIFVDPRQSRSLTKRGGERALLLVGTHHGEPWHAILVESDVSGGGRSMQCYLLESHGIDRGSTILFDIGLVLSKDAEFHSGGFPRNGRYEEVGLASQTTPFCVDSQGRVTAYLGG